MTKRESLKDTARSWGFSVDIDGMGEYADTYSRHGHTVTVWWSRDEMRVVRIFRDGTRFWGGYPAAFYLLALLGPNYGTTHSRLMFGEQPPVGLT